MAPKKNKGKAVAADQYVLDVLPPPVAIFDIGDTNNLGENYENCLKAVISMMQDSTGVDYTFVIDGKEVVVPVTPGESDKPGGVYVIRLKNGTLSVDLVATKYQNWFRGIVTTTGKRFEVDEFTGRIMKNSSTLGTSGSYTSLFAGEDIAVARIGYHRLVWSFYILARFGESMDRNFKNEKEAILVIILVFFEGACLVDVCEHVKQILTEQTEVGMGLSNQHQIRNWCNDSRDFFDVKGGEKKIGILQETSNVVKRVAYGLQIMCRSMWNSWIKPKNNRRTMEASSSKG